MDKSKNCDYGGWITAIECIVLNQNINAFGHTRCVSGFRTNSWGEDSIGCSLGNIEGIVDVDLILEVSVLSKCFTIVVESAILEGHSISWNPIQNIKIIHIRRRGIFCKVYVSNVNLSLIKSKLDKYSGRIWRWNMTSCNSSWKIVWS